jgi:hypothetical protein
MPKLTKRAPDWHQDAAGLIRENFDLIHTSFLNATRRAAWLGLFLNYVKIRGKQDGTIPHGQFGPWLEQHIPDLSRSQLGAYLTMGLRLAEKAKIQISDNRKFATVVNAGEIPEPVAALIDNKTQNALFLEFKQAELKDDYLRPKRGNLSGKGNTKKQRVDAQASTESARLEALELQADTNTAWLLENSDDQHFGLLSDDTRAELLDALDTAATYLRHLVSKSSARVAPPATQLATDDDADPPATHSGFITRSGTLLVHPYNPQEEIDAMKSGTVVAIIRSINAQNYDDGMLEAKRRFAAGEYLTTVAGQRFGVPSKIV